MVERTSTLRLRIDTGGADRAARDLDKVGDEAKEAAREVDRLGDESQRAGQRMERGLGGSAGRVVTRMGAMAGAATAAAAAFASIGAIRISADLESEFSKVETLLDDASFATGQLSENIDGLKDGIVRLRADTGETFANLSQGLFDLVSAGISAADSIEVLESATVLARAGVTDVSVAVDGATTAINAYGESAERAEIISSKFFTAQKFGKTTVEELARGLGQVAPLAAQLGVTLDELFASQAAATSAGIRQSEAYTGLKAALTNIVKPSQDAAAEAERLGVAFDTSTLKAKGLTEFLADIQESAEFTDESFQQLFGSAEALNFVLAVTGGGAETYARTLRELGDETKSVATLQEAAGKASETAGVALRELGGAVDQLAVIIGDAGALEGFTEVIRDLNEVLRSDAAKEFAESIGSGLGDATDAARGLLAVLQDIKELTSVATREGTPINAALGVGAFLERATPFGSTREISGDVFEYLAQRGREEEARSQTTAGVTEITADIADIVAAFGNADDAAVEFQARLSEIGEDTDFGKALAAFDGLLGGIVRASDAAAETAEEISGASEEAERLALAQATRDSFAPQLEAARALRDAAAISDEEYENTVRRLEIEAEITKEVERRTKAGEEFDAEVLASLIREREAILDAADAIIDARDRLRESVIDAADLRLDAITDINISGISIPELQGVLTKFNSDFQEALIDLQFQLEDGIITQEQFDEFKRTGEEFANDVEEKIVEGGQRAATILRDQIAGSVGFLLDDLLFNGGGRIDDFFEGLQRDFVNASLIDPIARAFAGDGGLVTNITKAFDEGEAKFRAAGEAIFGEGPFGQEAGAALFAAGAGFTGFKVGATASDLLGLSGNPASQKAGGIVGGAAGFAIAGPIGAAIGAALGRVIADLVSKPSDRTAQGVIRSETGQVLGRAQDGSGANANAQVRDALITSITDVTSNVLDLIGGNVTDIFGTGTREDLLNIAVRSDRKTGESFIDVGFQGANGEPVGGGRFAATEAGAIDAVREALRLTISSIRGGESVLIDYAEAAFSANEDIDSVVRGLGVLSNALADVGENGDALRGYIEASVAAGRSADEIAGGVTALKGVLELTIEPLSGIEQALKQIDDVVNPVIDDLKSLGLSLSDIRTVASDAERALGETFIGDVQDQILSLQNTTLAEYKRVLAEIEQRQSDAQTLRDRGAITAGEFESVQFLNALQAQKFFENLSADELENLGDFFGVLGERAGDTVVKLTRLTQGIVDFADNVGETSERLRSEAGDIQNAVDRAFDTRTSILDRFSPLQPQEQIGDIRGQLQQILAEVGQPGQSAEFITDRINRASELGRQFVDLSAEIFGPTGRFAQNRDFATEILAQIGEAGQGEVDNRLSILDAANSQVSILNEIREEISGPDPSLDFLQQTLDEGKVTNTILRELLEAYINAAGAQQQVLDPAALQAGSDAFFAAGGAQAPANNNAEIAAALQQAELAAQGRHNETKDAYTTMSELLGEIRDESRETADLLRAQA